MKKEHLFLIFAGILSGLIVFSAKIFSDFGFSLLEISIFPYIVSIIVLLPFVILIRRFRIRKENLRVLVIYGLVTALLSLAEFGGVVLGVSVAVAVLLIYTQPLWTVVFSRLFLKEKINFYKIASCIFVLVGVVILLNPRNATFLSLGVIVSIFGGVLLSVWIMLGRVSGLEGSHPVATQVGMAIFTIFFLILGYPLLILIKSPEITSLSLSFSLNAWIYLIVFSILVNVLSHLFIFYGSRKVPSSTAGIILLLEPLVAAILAALFLGQGFTWNIVVGGVLIIIANYLVIKYGEK